MGLIEIYKCDYCKKESTDPYYWLKVEVMGEFGSDQNYFCSIKCMATFFIKYKITYDEGVAILRKK